MDATIAELKVSVKWEVDGGGIFVHDAFVGNTAIDLSEQQMKEITGAIAGEYPDRMSGSADFDLFDVPVDVEYRFSLGTDDYFSAEHGNWLRGDDEEMIIDEVLLNGVDIKKHLTDAVIEKLEKQAVKHARMHESASKRYDKLLKKVEKRLDKNIRRGKIKSKLVGKDSKIPNFGYWFRRD